MSRLESFLLLVLLASGIGNNAYAQPCSANAGSNITLCQGSTATLGGTPSASAGSGGPYNYSWAPAGGLSCTNCPNPVVTAGATNVTYTLTVTEPGNGACNATSQVTVTSLPVPTASFSFAPNNQCSSTPVVFTNTSTGTGLSYSWNFGDPASGSANTSTQTSPSHTFVAPGSGSQSFTVTLIVTGSNGCTATSTQNITVQQSPQPDLMDPFSDFKNCDGSPTFNFEAFNNTSPAVNASYVINWGDGTPNFTAGPGGFVNVTHTYTGQNIFDLVFTVTGTNGCVTSTNFPVSNITNPAIGVANPGGTTGCGPLNLCFPLSNFAGNHPSTIYTINYGDGSPTDTIPHAPPASICHTYTESSCAGGGSYTFTMTAINACDISTATINPIRVYTAPQASFTAMPQPQCVNSPVTFTNTSVLGFNSTCSQSSVFTWNFGDGSPNVVVLTAAPQVHTYTAPGTYTVTLSAQNTCGTTNATQQVCIEAPPTPAFNINPGTGCIPLNNAVTNVSDTSNSCNTTWLWNVVFGGSPCPPGVAGFNFTGGTTANSWNPQFSFTNPGNYTVQLSLTNSCGTFNATQPVVANTVPQVTVAPLATVCAGTSVNPTATFTDCSLPITAYSWTFPTGTPATSNQEVPGSVSFNTGGTPTITASATNACGTGSGTTTITVTPQPTAPNIGSNSSICEGATLNLTTTTAGAGITYSWSGPNGFTSNQQNPSIPNTTLANAGNYILTIADNGCGSPSANVNVVINPAPVVTVTPNPVSLCEGQNASLTASGATSYTWSPAAGLSTTAGATVTANPTASTTYTVTGSQGGCSSDATVNVTVNPSPVVTAGPDLTLCNQPIPEQLIGVPAGGTWNGPNTTAGGVFTPSGVGTFIVTYTFTDGNSCTGTDDVQITVQNPANVVMPADEVLCLNEPAIVLVATPAGGTWSGTNVNAAGTFTPASNGNFTITYTVGSGTCASTDDMQVLVNNLPVVAAGANITVCIDAGLQNLNGTPLGGTWSGSGISGTQFNPATAGLGSHILTYTFTDPVTGCQNNATINATVNALPVVDAGPNITLCDQPLAEQLNGTPAGGTWSGANISAGGLFTPNGTGLFTVTYSFTDANGCTATSTADIQVISPTPANAGANQQVCIGAAPINLAATPIGGTWSGPHIAANGTFTPAVSGVFTVTYTVGTGTCLTTDDVDVTVHALPVVNAGTDPTVCIDAPAFNLIGAPAGGTWSGTGITNAAAGTFSPSASGVGSFVVTYSFTDGNGCTNTDNATVNVNALPVVDAGADTTLCNQPFPVSFSGTPAGGTWSGAGITAGGVYTPAGVGSFVVTYTFTLGTGCSASDTRTITVVDPVPANAGPDVEACIGDAIILLGGAPAAGSWSGTGVTPGGEFNPNNAGTFNLTYSFGAGNCATNDQMTVTVFNLPVVNAGPNVSICVSEPAVNFTGAPAGGTWSGTGITNAAIGTFNPGIAGVGNYNNVYTYSDPVTSCLNRDTLVATVNPLPVPSFSNNAIACIGTSESFINNTTGATNYQWNFGDGGTSATANPSHTYSAIGTYTIQLIATSAAGCVDSITGIIEVREPPVALFTVAPDSGCAPLIVNFTNFSSGVGITENWDFGNGQSFFGTNPPAVTYQQGVLADTTYYIILSVTNFCGTVTHTDSIIAMPSPTAVFGPMFSTGCSPYHAEFANNSLGLPDTYFWDFGDGTTSTTSDSLFTHTFTTGLNPTIYTIMLAVSNECGVDTAYHDITVLPNTVNAFFNTPITSGCEPLTLTFTQLSTGAPFYNWDFGDGNTSLIHSPTHTFTQAGTYTVQLFINDGCSYDTASVVITVFPSPTLSFTWSPDSVCVNIPFQFINTSGPLAGVSWNFGDGNTSNLNNPQHSYPSSGTYTVTLNGTSLTNGCIASVSQQVTVANNPIAAFIPNPGSGCIPLPVSFSNQTTNAQFYAWNFGDGNTSVNANPNHIYTAAGNYMVQLIATNINGCSDTAYMPVAAFPVPVASFIPNTTDPCYQPVSANFTNSSTGAVGYSWNFGNGQTSVLNNPSTNYSSPGDYIVELVAENQFGCKDTAYQTVEIFQLPTADFTVNTDTWCALYPVDVTNNSLFANQVVWDFGEGSSTSFNPSYSYQNPGIYDITLMVYTNDGCGDTLTLPAVLEVFPTPTAGFTYENIHLPDPLSGTVAFTNTSEGATNYEWNFGNGTSTETHPTHRFEFFGTANVMLIAINEFGCPDTLIMPINIMYFKGLFFPNVLSYGHSSYEVSHFVPKGVGLKTFYVGIYDTWGNLMWECRELDPDGRPICAWDGTYKGKPVPQDAYVWKAEAIFLDESLWEGQHYPKDIWRSSGTVTVLR